MQLFLKCSGLEKKIKPILVLLPHLRRDTQSEMKLPWKQRVNLNGCDGPDSKGPDADSGSGGVLRARRRQPSNSKTLQESTEQNRQEAERIQRTPPVLLNDSARPKVARAHNCFMIVGLGGVFQSAERSPGSELMPPLPQQGSSYSAPHN